MVKNASATDLRGCNEIWALDLLHSLTAVCYLALLLDDLGLTPFVQDLYETEAVPAESVLSAVTSCLCVIYSR